MSMHIFKGCTNSNACNAYVTPGGLWSIVGTRHLTMIGTGATLLDGQPPVRDEYDLNQEAPGRLVLDWTDVVFVQWQPLIGPIWLRLSPSEDSTNVLESVSDSQDSFFPAKAETEFYFQMEVPRLGWRFENLEPMRTISIEPHMHGYPVQSVYYEVPEPVRFYRVRGWGAPRHIDLGTHDAVFASPFTSFLQADVEVEETLAGGYLIHATLRPYRVVPGPKAFQVAWYLRCPSPYDCDIVARGVLTHRRGRRSRISIPWSPRRSGEVEHEPWATLVFLSLSPRTPGHTEVVVDLAPASESDRHTE